MLSLAPLQRVTKIDPAISERTVSAEQTLRQALPIAFAKGVRRVADLTGLDRIGIPVFTAIVPDSDDSISVYNGKGASPLDARVGALMEAIERQTALNVEIPVVAGSYQGLRNGRIGAIDPQSFNHKLRNDYSENASYPWIAGYDLIRDQPVLVPAGLAAFGRQYTGPCSPYELNSSNGLASGNCFEEAVCHGLCELLERDAWTFAELRSQWIPVARREALFGEGAPDACDDPNIHSRIDLRSGEPFESILTNFERAGLQPVIRDITSAFGIACVMAAVADDSIPGFPQAHGGMGAHPNARIAILRALSEVAQSRVVDIQGVREDLHAADAGVHPAHTLTQRVPKIDCRRWMLQQAGHQRSWREMPSFENDDLAEDIRLILSRLVANGIERAIVVDFSEPGPFSVVRILVPGLEFWAFDKGKIGPRAVEFWREYV